MMRVLILGSCFLAFTLSACDGIGGGVTKQQKCLSIRDALCGMACECTEGDACNAYYEGSLRQYPVRADCEEFWNDFCELPEEGLPSDEFLDGCLDALALTTCHEEGGGSVIMPEECVMQAQ